MVRCGMVGGTGWVSVVSADCRELCKFVRMRQAEAWAVRPEGRGRTARRPERWRSGQLPSSPGRRVEDQGHARRLPSSIYVFTVLVPCQSPAPQAIELVPGH